MSSATGARPDRAAAILLGVLAVALYVPSIWWGLPHATGPERVHPWGSDEIGPLGPVAELYSVFVTQGPVFNPQYPLFHYLVSALFVGPYVAWLAATGALTMPSSDYPFGLVDPVPALAAMTLLSRLPSLLMAAGVVVAAHRIGLLLWDRSTGLLAAVLVLFSLPMFYYARTSNVDMGALFWTAWGLVVYAATLTRGLTQRRAIALGALAALATATKDPSYAIFVAVGAVVVARHVRTGLREGERAWALARAPLAGLGVALAVYAVASGLALSPSRYFQHVDFIASGSGLNPRFYGDVPATLSGYIGLLGSTAGHVRDALGLPTALLAVLGVGLCIRRTPRATLFALPALAVAFGVILPVRFVQLRFVLPIAFVLAFYAALALSRGARHPSVAGRWVARLSIIVAAGWSLLRGADLTYQMIHDSRYEVGRWLETRARTGDEIGYYGSPVKLPHLAAGIIARPMPGQAALPDRLSPAAVDPDFVLVIPQQTFEPVHEWTMPDSVYRALEDGSLGYEPVLRLQTPSLFRRRPVPFVNPPVTVYARRDGDPGDGNPAGTLDLPRRP